MLKHSPERSYKRLNPALRGTLANCIRADLPFREDTFRRIYNELRGCWWFGDGAGSHVGEHFYTTACACNHASAQQSFEHFAGRPACLWEEQVKTTLRLHVGAQFTWHGVFVTVTSMRKDSLVACTYKDYEPRVRGLKPGATIGYDPEHLITSAKRDGNVTVLRVVTTISSRTRDIARRFTIPYAEIVEVRRTARARVKLILDKISKCNPSVDSVRLTHEINQAHFRHFELAEIRAAFRTRKDWISKQDNIAAWRKGANGAWLDVNYTLVRLKNDRVECSNGNSVSKAAAARVLPILLDQRNTIASLSLPLDSYQINRVSPEGVRIGCTLVPWTEIDRITPELTAPANV